MTDHCGVFVVATVLGCLILPAQHAVAQQHKKPSPPSPGVPVIELVPTGGALLTQLQREADSATAHGQRALVEIGAPWCGFCMAFLKSLHDPGMVAALHGARLMYVDLDQWSHALVLAGYPTENLPILILVGSDGRPDAEFDVGQWGKYATTIHVSVNEDDPNFWTPKILGPPLQAFLSVHAHMRQLQ